MISYNIILFVFTDDTPLSTEDMDIGVITMSPSAKPPSIDQNTEIDQCLSDNSLACNTAETVLSATSSPFSRVTFIRDVAPYQRQRYQSEICYKGEKIRIQKDRYISRVQGVKTSLDAKYASVLPEIKVSSFCVIKKNSLFGILICFSSRFHSTICNTIN